MQYKVYFKSISVAIIGYMAVVVGCICFQVPHAHLFKDKTKGFELGFESLGIDAHSSNGY